MAVPMMRSNVLRHPLDTVLRSEANIRLLRLLAFDDSMTAGEASRKTGITEAASRRALTRLVTTGFVRRVGSGKYERYELRGDEPLARALQQLFGAEEERYETVLSELRSVMNGIPEVLSAWIPSLPTEFGRELEILLVTETSAAQWVADEVRGALRGIEVRLDLVVEIQVFTQADAPAMQPDAVLLAGIGLPTRAARRGGPATHADRDERSLRMAECVRDLLRRDRGLKDRALRHVERLLREGQGMASQDLLEWKQVLETYSAERLAEFLVSSSSRAERLRQSSPFLAVLTPEERERLFDAIEAKG